MHLHRSRITIMLAGAIAATCPCARAAHAGSVNDPKVRSAVHRGLDWIANSQSRLGHWTANDGRYGTAMTALAGMALLAEGSTTTQGKYAKQHPPGRRLPGQPQPAQWTDRRQCATIATPTGTATRCCFSRRSWARKRTWTAARTLIEVLTKAVEFTGEAQTAGRRLGICQRQGWARLRRGIDHDHPGPGPARLPQRRHSRPQGDHR